MWLDKLGVALVSPLGTSLLLGVIALLFAARRRLRWAFSAGALSIAWVVLWSLPSVSSILVGALESQYPPIDPSALPTRAAMVVLGGGISAPAGGNPFPKLHAAADRVWHAARVYRAGKAPLIVLSGGTDPAEGRVSEAEASAILLRDLGVPDSAIVLETQSQRTAQNAEFTSRLLAKRDITSVLLVTSAMHMHRAARLFEAAGLQVFPVATDYEYSVLSGPRAWIPDADALLNSGRALKELVARVLGR